MAFFIYFIFHFFKLQNKLKHIAFIENFDQNGGKMNFLSRPRTIKGIEIEKKIFCRYKSAFLLMMYLYTKILLLFIL